MAAEAPLRLLRGPLSGHLEVVGGGGYGEKGPSWAGVVKGSRGQDGSWSSPEPGDPSLCREREGRAEGQAEEGHCRPARRTLMGQGKRAFR